MPYVSSYNNDRLVVFDGAGNFLRSFTGGGLDAPDRGRVQSLVPEGHGAA